MKKVFLALCMFCLLCSGRIVDERLNYRIVAADDAPAAVAAACNELKNYLQRIYGKPISLNGSTEKLVFLVGASTDAADFSLPTREAMPEGFAVLRKGRSVLLYGYDDKDAAPYSKVGENGSILSVFYFLRKYAGLKVYAPDEKLGEKIVLDAPLDVPEADIPSFSFKVRGMGRFFPNDYDYPSMDRYAKKQLCSIPYWAQSDYDYRCIDRWNKRFKDRPELFGLYDGKRQNANYPLHLPCLSNPEVKQIILKDIIDGIAKSKHPVHTLRIFCDAPFRRCECGLCSNGTTNEDYFYGFILDVYDQVRKVYPGLHLFLQEKSPSHINPPTCRERLDGIAVDLSTGLPAVLDYSRCRWLYDAWAAKGARPMVRLYPRLPKWDSYPIINPHGQADCLKALKGVCWGQRDSDSASYYPRFKRRTPYIFSALDNFVYANVLVDADSDVDALMSEFCGFMYPGAEKEMLAFYACMERMYRSCNVNDDPLMTCYAYDKLGEPLQLLDKAVEKCREPFWMARMQAAFAEFMSYSKQMLDENEKFIEFRQDAERRQEEFRREYPRDKVLAFGGESTRLKLCPVNMLKSAYQDSFVDMSVQDGNFVICVEAREKQVERIMRRALPGQNGNVWADDCFEIMLAPEDGGLPYIQLIINANGAMQALRYDGKIRRSSKYAQVAQLGVTAEIGKDGWRGRIVFPVKLLEEFCPGGKGRFGIFRTNRLEPLPGKDAEYPTVSAFSDAVPQGNYHNRSLYRSFIYRTR